MFLALHFIGLQRLAVAVLLLTGPRKRKKKKCLLKKENLEPEKALGEKKLCSRKYGPSMIISYFSPGSSISGTQL